MVKCRCAAGGVLLFEKHDKSEDLNDDDQTTAESRKGMVDVPDGIFHLRLKISRRPP